MVQIIVPTALAKKTMNKVNPKISNHTGRPTATPKASCMRMNATKQMTAHTIASIQNFSGDSAGPAPGRSGAGFGSG